MINIVVLSTCEVDTHSICNYESPCCTAYLTIRPVNR